MMGAILKAKPRPALAELCQSNAALASLSPPALASLLPHIFCDAYLGGKRLGAKALHFPTSGVVSVSQATRCGHHIEVANVGREAGIVPTSAAHGHSHNTVLVSGAFLSIQESAANRAAASDPEIRAMLDACRDWLLVQARQIAACNAAHGATPRLARWLLHVADRAGDMVITATQDDIALALGLRRTTITLFAMPLRVDGMIAYCRGRITIRDRKALQAIACDCGAALTLARAPFARAALKAEAV